MLLMLFDYNDGEQSGQGEAIVIVNSLDPIDASKYLADGYLHIRVYVSDASKVSGGQIELSSSGTSDKNENSWNLSDLGLVNGWNDLYLPINSARAEGGEADFSALNYFRIYVLKASGSDFELKIEDAYLCLATNEPAPATSFSALGEILLAGAALTTGIAVSSKKKKKHI